MNASPLLEVRDLKTVFRTEQGVVTAVDGVHFALSHGDTLGIVGESGCGKSVTALSIMRLIPQPPAKIARGEIMFKGEDLLKLPLGRMRRIRGKEIAMVFQEPMTSLNPVFTAGKQISEAVALHEGVSSREAMGKTVEMLHLVGIPSPEKRIRDYPHQLSGGMRQRVMIAMALSCGPSILVADEPTTALDVTVQAQILRLIADLQERIGMAVILITHDLGIVAQMTKRVIVMYMGTIVEGADVDSLFKNPLHPYTQGLLHSRPVYYKDLGRKKRLEEIKGSVGSLLRPPAGCYFSPRCPFLKPICREGRPTLREIGPGHVVRCFLAGEGDHR